MNVKMDDCVNRSCWFCHSHALLSGLTHSNAARHILAAVEACRAASTTCIVEAVVPLRLHVPS